MSEQPALQDVVLGASPRAPRRFALVAGLTAAALHLGAAAAAVALGSTRELPKRPSRPLVVFEHVVELEPPAPEPAAPEPVAPEPEVAPPPPPVQPRLRPKAEPKPLAKAPEPAPAEPPPEASEPPPEPSEPPPAAQAGEVVAAQAGATQAPAFQVASQAGGSYAGGRTTAAGTGTAPNHTGQTGTGNGQGLSRARSAQVRSNKWPCGWPPEAEELEIEEAIVIVQASVRPDGTLADIKVLADPGYGFGRRAASCAKTKIKFEPALDAAGMPTFGTTAPVRVRFVREE